MTEPDSTSKRRSGKSDGQADPFQRREAKERTPRVESLLHVLGDGIVCDTDRRGHAIPQGASPTEIVLDASEGFIPLWARNSTLRWRFRERSLNYFANPSVARAEIRRLFAKACLAWGSAAPVTFKEDEDVWDFEILMRSADDCNPGGGCVLASAFFPDSGRHQLQLYPKMFTQSPKEQIDTFIHEIGHVFGLRHFFANISEVAWPSEIFGTHRKFSIMNYGELSELTDADKDDLRRLYRLAWAGTLTHINGTPIRFVEPYHVLACSPNKAVTIEPPQTVFLPRAGLPSGAVTVDEFIATTLPQSRAAYLDEI